jgi:hypothetical protein
MGLEFLKRVQSATAVVGAVTFVLVSVYYDSSWGLGILAGCGWGIANFWAMTRVLSAVLTSDGVQRKRALIFAAIKFPVLYFIGFLALRSEWFPPISLLAGFSLLFLVILLKAAGRAFMHLDDRLPQKHGKSGQPVSSHS